jgi:hypothetical protein
VQNLDHSHLFHLYLESKVLIDPVESIDCPHVWSVTLFGTHLEQIFEKVIKTDPLKINIWERNFQLALGSLPVYLAFIAFEGGGEVGIGGGWSFISWLVSFLGAAGGLLVALSIKYGDSILKTLATTGAIILSSVLDHVLLGGPLTPVMMIAGVQVVLAICNYTFDTTPPEQLKVEEPPEEMKKDSERTVMTPDEEVALVSQKMSA